MTALEYMEKQLRRHRRSYERESLRGVPEDMLCNIELKIGYYERAVAALRILETTQCEDCEYYTKLLCEDNESEGV